MHGLGAKKWLKVGVPVLSKFSQILERYVNNVIDEEKNKRQDLFVLARSYIGQLRNKANEMIKEADFHEVTEKLTKNSQDPIKVVNGNGNSSSAKNHAEPKEITERSEKKVSATSSSSSSSTANSNANNSVKHSSSSTNSISDKGQRKERESSEKVITVKEKSSKESKRDKEDGEIRKRDRGEKRRDRDRNKMSTPPSYYSDRYDASPTYNQMLYAHDSHNLREHSPHTFYVPGSPSYAQNSPTHIQNERDRDLSSISNSSKGSTNRRSQDSPEIDRDMKRRRIDNSKKNDDVTIVVDEGSKRERGSTRSKEKREKSSYDDIDVRKDKRVSRKRNV